MRNRCVTLLFVSPWSCPSEVIIPAVGLWLWLHGNRQRK
jgi:hypothetical protein